MIRIFLLGCFLWTAFTGAYAQTDDQRSKAFAANLNPALLYPSVYPDRIIINLTDSPESSVAVNWRTDVSQNSGWVQFGPATPGTQFLRQLDSVASRVETLTVSYTNEPEVTANYHSAVMTGLEPGKSYVYRVGNGKYRSEWFQFSVPGGKKLSFLYFGDAQNDIRNHWSRVLRNAFRIRPDIDFMLHGGDLINRHNHDIEWGEWFAAGAFIHATIPSAMTPGNHEYGKGPVLSPQWRAQFNLPENGPKGLGETSFEINYEQLKMVSLDATMIYDFKETEQASVRWLDSVLTANPRKWTVILIHFPFYSTKENRDNPDLRKVFQPVIEKHKVDLVLQGHDHAYGRGVKESDGHATAYIVSNAGPKMYEIGENKDWMKKKLAMTQLFQLISIDGDQLEYSAYKADGTLYDAFHLRKNKDKRNILEEKIPDTPESKGH
ncbi:MAG: metallophosphoesterase family protein [Leadbetterella sp.]|nr:metallophosphoesterase family protein [Leadbetterella sp.]